jgi:HPt (histidine-containing phosphotransfer) domain-containing protein/HAMP domain-containing protein
MPAPRGKMDEPGKASFEVRTSLRAKLVRTMITTLAVVASAVVLLVAALSFWSARDTLAVVETNIRESINRKGRGLVKNHSLALRGLAADNAFSDVRRLVEDTVQEDEEVVYGLFVGANRETWAYSRHSGRAANEADALTEVGLDEDALSHMALAPRAERRFLFDQDLFQFSAPVQGEDDTTVGTIIYGVSTEPLNRALALARRDFGRSLLMAVVLLALVSLGTTFLGVILARRAAARITSPLADLTRAAAAVASGSRNQRVLISSQDELEALGSAFNQMVVELNDSYARLEGLNRTLERRVEERTRDLAEANRNLRVVLDTVNEGLVTVSKDGFMAAERSAMIDRWFGPYSGTGVRFADYIRPIDRNFAESFELGYELLLEGMMPLELCLAQLPSRLRTTGREFKCSYLPVSESGEHLGMLVAIEDVTEQTQLAQQEAEQRELLALFQSFTRDRAGFLAFFDEASQLVAELSSEEADLITRKRLIHTLKGNASLAGLTLVADLCHRAESDIDEASQLSLKITVAALRDRWLTLTQAVTGFLGDRVRNVVEVQLRELDQLCGDLRNGASSAQVIRRLTSWRYEPVERALGRMAEHARALAQRLDKGDVMIKIEADRIRLDPQRWSAFWSELVHVVRNAVDHGFETATERRAGGKSPRPQLRLGAYVRQSDLVIEIEDDGRGIDWKAVRKLAHDRGLPAESDSDLLQALVTPGFTTRGEVNTVSGRGMGLAAVYQQVFQFKGRVSVGSVRYRGTCWKFSFPISSVGIFDDTESTRDGRGPARTVMA